jgi:uridine kinase
MLVGICGRSSSGKDSIVQSIASVNRQILHINCDIFFKNKTNCIYKGYTCWEHENALHMDHVRDVIKALKEGKGTIIKDRSPWCGPYECEIFKDDLINKNITIFQGFLLFSQLDIANQLDCRIFIDISDLEIFYRRLMRQNNLAKYIHDVLIPVSKEYEEDQKKRSHIIIDNTANTLAQQRYTTDVIVKQINMQCNVGNAISSPYVQGAWTVYPGDLLCDHEWHPIDFMDMKDWVQLREQELNHGGILEGNTFDYRKNLNTGNFEVRLSPAYEKYRHLSRYTRLETLKKS